MHNKFKRIDGIFALPYASGVCASETIFRVQEKNSSHEIKSKQNCAIDGCPSVYRVEGGVVERIIFLSCNAVVVAAAVSFFARLHGFLSVCCTVIAGPQIFRLLQLKYLFKI